MRGARLGPQFGTSLKPAWVRSGAHVPPGLTWSGTFPWMPSMRRPMLRVALAPMFQASWTKKPQVFSRTSEVNGVFQRVASFATPSMAMRCVSPMAI